jgi:hypothetical protein
MLFTERQENVKRKIDSFLDSFHSAKVYNRWCHMEKLHCCYDVKISFGQSSLVFHSNHPINQRKGIAFGSMGIISPIKRPINLHHLVSNGEKRNVFYKELFYSGEKGFHRAGIVGGNFPAIV